MPTAILKTGKKSTRLSHLQRLYPYSELLSIAMERDESVNIKMLKRQ